MRGALTVGAPAVKREQNHMTDSTSSDGSADGSIDMKKQAKRKLQRLDSGRARAGDVHRWIAAGAVAALLGALVVGLGSQGPAVAQGTPGGGAMASLEPISFDSQIVTDGIAQVSALMRTELTVQDLDDAQQAQLLFAIGEMRARMGTMRSQLEAVLTEETWSPNALPAATTVASEPTSAAVMLGLRSQLARLEAMGMNDEAAEVRTRVMTNLTQSFDAWEAGVASIEQDLIAAGAAAP